MTDVIVGKNIELRVAGIVREFVWVSKGRRISVRSHWAYKIPWRGIEVRIFPPKGSGIASWLVYVIDVERLGLPRCISKSDPLNSEELALDAARRVVSEIIEPSFGGAKFFY